MLEKAIKELTKSKLAKVEKTDEGLVVTRVGYLLNDFESLT